MPYGGQCYQRQTEFQCLFEMDCLTHQLPGLFLLLSYLTGGGCEIRTHGEVAPSLVFKTSAIDHSANPPMILLYISNFVEAPVITITNAYPQIIRETP